ncbi:MAG: methylthioribulose 1-phosphate dehydratase [Myxococcota bacterium]
MNGIASELAAVARRCAARGWVPATSGNFSARLPSGDLLITPSGADKGALQPEALLVLDPRGAPRVPGQVPSAETGLHVARYAADPQIGAIVHTHATRAVLLSRRVGAEVVLEGFELLKAFVGVTTHEARLVVPVIDNHQDMAALAPIAEAAVARCAPTWAFLVRGHGVYVWGPDLAVAERHAEALDVLFHYLLEEGR